MLLEFKCSNYKSIKDEVTFSMIASSDTTNENRLKQYNKYKILNSAVIYGPNGSGKSNFINALSFMVNLVCNSINHQPGSGIFQAPHKLSDSYTPSTFFIQFIKNDVRFAYGFSIIKNLIDEEYLYFFPNGKKKRIFERKGKEIFPGDSYKNEFEESKRVLKNNRLFLSCAANFSNVNEIEEAFLFFKSDMIIYNPEINNWTEYSIDLMQNDSHMRHLFVDYLQALGTGIKDVNVHLEKVKVTDLQQELKMPDELRDLILSQTNEANKIEAKIIYDNFEIDINNESNGIKKLFEILCPIFDILSKGKILICDELETGLHESIVSQIIQLFNIYNNGDFAQLIFTTHNTNLLDGELFRRDQIWFTQLTSQRSTDLYSLVEIKNVRKTENLRKGYISGKYGAMPMLNKSFFQEMKDAEYK